MLRGAAGSVSQGAFDREIVLLDGSFTIHGCAECLTLPVQNGMAGSLVTTATTAVEKILGMDQRYF